MNAAPEDSNEVPYRVCQANIALVRDAGHCTAPATHVITGPDERLQWYGCDIHAGVAERRLECKVEPYPAWYKKHILKESMSWDEYLETLKK